MAAGMRVRATRNHRITPVMSIYGTSRRTATLPGQSGNAVIAHDGKSGRTWRAPRVFVGQAEGGSATPTSPSPGQRVVVPGRSEHGFANNRATVLVLATNEIR